VKLQWHQRSQYTFCLRSKDSLLWRSGVDARPEDTRDHFIEYNTSARSPLRVSLLSRHLRTLASIRGDYQLFSLVEIHQLLALSYHKYLPSLPKRTMSYYFCNNCGDGPHNASLNLHCPNCHVLQNNALQCNSHDYHSNLYPLNVHPDPRTSHSISTCANNRYAPDTITYLFGRTTQSSPAGASITFPAGNTPYSAPYSQRPERPPVYRWQCCKCGGDNSYKTDQGCANCCNHWRSSCCYVYDANAQRR
jgi:hypothetical protein